MCLSPRQIKNRFYQPSDPLSPYYITCNCGQCEECHNTRVSEVLFRAERMQDYVNRLEGVTVFCTLTFNEPSLNYYTYIDEYDGLTKKISTWNHKLFKRWRNRINMQVMRQYGYRLYYLCTCERGHDNIYTDSRGRQRKGTRRPHYHVILWFVPTDRKSAELSYDKAFEIITRHWSHDARHASFRDISDSDKPYTRFVATSQPIGYVYNELIGGRLQLDALKYIVKYCFKDSDETVLNINPTKIISSTHAVSFVDACPRLRQSNGIGESWLDEVFNRSDYESCAISLADWISQNSDGEKLRVPRYYIKKLNSISGVTYSDIVPDFSRTFDGSAVVYRHNQDSYLELGPIDVHDELTPIFGETHYTEGDLFTPSPSSAELLGFRLSTRFVLEDTTHWRLVEHRHQHRNRFGTAFNNRNIENSARGVYDSLHAWFFQPFNFEKLEFLDDPILDRQRFPFSSGLPDERFEEFYRSYQNAEEIYNNCLDHLSGLTFEEFVNLYKINYHYPDYDRLVNLNLQMSSPQLCSSYTFDLLQTLRDFMSLRAIDSYVNSAVARYNLKVQYETTGKHESAKKQPMLFVPRIE